MGYNYGKQFESKFRETWNNQFKDSFLIRLQDAQSGYYGASNPCDFIGFVKNKLFLIECKSIHGNTLPFSNIRQYDKLLSNKGKTNVFPGIILWWVDLDKIAWVPIESIEQMKKDNKKSVNIKMLLNNEYGILEIPSVKKRIFMDSDYTVLTTLGDN